MHFDIMIRQGIFSHCTVDAAGFLANERFDEVDFHFFLILGFTDLLRRVGLCDRQALIYNIGTTGTIVH